MKTANQFEIIDTTDNTFIGGPYQYESTAAQLAAELNEHYDESERFVVIKRKALMPYTFIDLRNGLVSANAN